MVQYSDLKHCRGPSLCEETFAGGKKKNDLVKRLLEAGSTGLDLSPGDSLCMEAAVEIERLRNGIKTAIDKLDWMIAPGQTRKEAVEILKKILDTEEGK